MQSRNANDVKAQPKAQKSFQELNGKTLVLHSVKVYANKSYDDKVAVNLGEFQAKVKAVKPGDVAAFREIFRPLTRKDKLAIDSASQKDNLCNHARERQHCYIPIAEAMGREDIAEKLRLKKAKAPKATKATKAAPKTKSAKRK